MTSAAVVTGALRVKITTVKELLSILTKYMVPKSHINVDATELLFFSSYNTHFQKSKVLYVFC